MTDSDCDLWYNQLDELNIQNIQMPYSVEDTVYFYDLGKTTDFKTFYNNLRKEKRAATSSLNAEEYKDIIEPIFKNGEDILYICFSHEMSGTFNQLRTAVKELKETYPDRKLTMFNTKAISVPAGIQAIEAAKLKQKGASDEDIVKFLKDFANRVGCYFAVDNLMHLKRGGRLSSTAAFAGTLLNIKPVLTFDEKGSLKVINKLMGRKKIINFLAQEAIDNADMLYDIYVLDADCREDGEIIKNIIMQKHPKANIINQTVGPIVGVHCGPGVLAVIYVTKQRVITLANNDNVEVL